MLARVLMMTAVVATYVTLHIGITAVMYWQELERFEDRDPPAHAVVLGDAVERFLAGDASARAVVLAERAWFDENVRDGWLAFSAADAALSGRPDDARHSVGELDERLAQRRQLYDREVDTWAQSTVGFALPSALLVVFALFARRRRRRAVADVVEVVRRHVPVRPWWWRPVFLVLTGIGFTLLVVGLFAGLAATRANALPGDFRLISGAGAAVAIAAGSLILRRTRRRAARDAASVLLADGRRPVLYLRSFADDPTSASVDPLHGGWEATVMNVLSREEQLAGALSAFGPVIAVGRPGEPLPFLGAARFYLSPDQWQPEVRRLMELSQLVVLRLGAGEGLWWEVEQVRATQPARKLVLLVPGEWAGLSERLRTPSPVRVVSGGGEWVSAVVTFDEDWNPHSSPVAPLKGKASLTMPAHDVARAMREALAAVGVRKQSLVVRINLRSLTNLGKVLLIVPVAVLLLRVGLLIFTGTPELV
jgi:hypothetical protein